MVEIGGKRIPLFTHMILLPDTCFIQHLVLGIEYVSPEQTRRPVLSRAVL